MNSNNNNENHEIAVYHHFAHSSVLFRLTCLLLFRYYISGKTIVTKVKLLLFPCVINRKWTTSKTSRHNTILNNDRSQDI